MSTVESDMPETFQMGIQGKERVVVYVDGMNLYHGVRSFGSTALSVA